MLHKTLTADKWFKLNIFEQLANVGSEVERAINWRKKDNQEYAMLAQERALELLSLTIDDPKNMTKLKELTRLYEVLADYFYGENIFSSNEALWQKYFYAFNYRARINI